VPLASVVKLLPAERRARPSPPLLRPPCSPPAGEVIWRYDARGPSAPGRAPPPARPEPRGAAEPVPRAVDAGGRAGAPPLGEGPRNGAARRLRRLKEASSLRLSRLGSDGAWWLPIEGLAAPEPPPPPPRSAPGAAAAPAAARPPPLPRSLAARVSEVNDADSGALPPPPRPPPRALASPLSLRRLVAASGRSLGARPAPRSLERCRAGTDKSTARPRSLRRALPPPPPPPTGVSPRAEGGPLPAVAGLRLALLTDTASGGCDPRPAPGGSGPLGVRAPAAGAPAAAGVP
jgi:hypothetical protein